MAFFDNNTKKTKIFRADNEEDSDIKIFSSSKFKKKKEIDTSLVEIDEELAIQSYNGNISKAKDLGSILAQMTSKEKDIIDKLIISDKIKKDENFLNQIDLLFVFTIIIGLDLFLQSHLIARTAMAKFYYDLQNDWPEIYSKLENSAAFSFYFLDIRRGLNDTDKKIGESFAMMCFQKNDKIYAEQGKLFYNIFLGKVKKIINEINFSK
jgi:hypothetical protein